MLCSGPGKLTQALDIELRPQPQRPDRWPDRHLRAAAGVARRRGRRRPADRDHPRRRACRGASSRPAAAISRGRCRAARSPRDRAPASRRRGRRRRWRLSRRRSRRRCRRPFHRRCRRPFRRPFHRRSAARAAAGSAARAAAGACRCRRPCRPSSRYRRRRSPRFRRPWCRCRHRWPAPGFVAVAPDEPGTVEPAEPPVVPVAPEPVVSVAVELRLACGWRAARSAACWRRSAAPGS